MKNKRCRRGATLGEKLAYYSSTAKNGCIEWTGFLNEKGYGKVMVDKKGYRVHRLAWTQVHGEIPEGMFILHRCDNRKCLNVDHLFIGTHADNMADMVMKGRQTSGHNGSGKPKVLNYEQALDIITDYSNGDIYRVLSKKHGVSVGTISKVINNKYFG